MMAWSRLVCGRSELRQITGQLQGHAGDSQEAAAQESAHCDRCTPVRHIPSVGSTYLRSLDRILLKGIWLCRVYEK
jgi:hypothetical protein